jgi:hypothetical protein
MSITFDRVGVLVRSGEVRISDHGYEEMSDEDILARDVLVGVFDGVVLEDYPMYPKRPMCSCAAEGSRTAADPRRLGNSKGFTVTSGCCHGVQTESRFVV